MRTMIAAAVSALALGCSYGFAVPDGPTSSTSYVIGASAVHHDVASNVQYLTLRNNMGDRFFMVDWGRDGDVDLAYHNGAVMDPELAQGMFSGLMEIIGRQEGSR